MMSRLWGSASLEPFSAWSAGQTDGLMTLWPWGIPISPGRGSGLSIPRELWELQRPCNAWCVSGTLHSSPSTLPKITAVFTTAVCFGEETAVRIFSSVSLMRKLELRERCDLLKVTQPDIPAGKALCLKLEIPLQTFPLSSLPYYLAP